MSAKPILFPEFQRCPQYCEEFHDELWLLHGGAFQKRKRYQPYSDFFFISSVWGSLEIQNLLLRAFPGCFRTCSGFFSGNAKPYSGHLQELLGLSNKCERWITGKPWIYLTKMFWILSSATSVQELRTDVVLELIRRVSCV